jgi:uncharacterized protein
MTELPGPTDGYPWVPDTEWPMLAPFWSALANGYLAFPRCTSCLHFQWYPEDACDDCQSEDLVWTPVRPGASVHSFTVLRRTLLPGFGTPLPIVLVDIDEAPGVRMITNLIGDVEPRTGLLVEIVRREVIPGVILPFARTRNSASSHGDAATLEVSLVTA